VTALRDQAARLAVPSRAYFNDRLGPFLAELCRITGLDAALPMNTGAEAVETAIKAARRWGYRVKGIAATAPRSSSRRQFPRAHHHIVASRRSGLSRRFWSFAPASARCRSRPRRDGARDHAADCGGAGRADPGRGLARVPPAGGSRACAACATPTTCLLILDEVQSRSRAHRPMVRVEHEHVRPDGHILGRRSARCAAVSAFLGRRDLMDVFTRLAGSTFGGNRSPPGRFEAIAARPRAGRA